MTVARTSLSPLARLALGLLTTCSTAATAVGVSGLMAAPRPVAPLAVPVAETVATSGTPAPQAGRTTPPRGAAPRIAYAVDPRPTFGDGHFRVVLPGGDTVAMPRGPMGAWTVQDAAARTVVREYQTEAGAVLQVVGPDGTLLHEESGLPWVGLSATPDAAVAGWQTASGRIRVREADGALLSLPRTPRPAGLGTLLGSDTCREAAPEGGGCTAIVTARRGPARLTTSHGIVDRLPGVGRALDADARGRVLAVLTRPGCYGVLTSPGAAPLRRVCAAEEPVALGTRGRVAALADPVADGHRTVVVRGGDGAVVRSWRGLGVVTEVAWEDATHLLAVAHRGARWDLLRLDLDGPVVRAAPTRRTGEFTPYRLPTT